MHLIALWWAWLVVNGIWHYVLAWAVTSLLTWLWAHRLLKGHRQRQEKIIDLLDPDTPGGMQTVVNAVQDNRQHTHVHGTEHLR